MARKKTTVGTSIGLPADYRKLLESLKARIQQAQTKAMLSVNRELIRLYWDIGRRIVERQEQEGWGKGVVDRLAGDIQSAFPGIQGFSPRNVWRMRTFYLAYTQGVTDVPQPVAGIDGVNLPQAVAEIPWGHNVWLLEKVKNAEQRLWYAAKTLEHGWSRAVLTVQIERDLLFYHLKLRCFVVIDLKMKRFTPEDVGKMNFYLSAIDSQMSHASDAPAIGLILCKDRDRIIAEYALRDIAKPIGVAQWQTKLVQSLPETLKGSLPSIEELEAELGKEEGP
jgi:hypothetical protein